MTFDRTVLLQRRLIMLYSSDDWKSLEPLTRCELILVVEGVKPAVITRGNWTAFQRIVRRTGLEYASTWGPYPLRLAARVAKPVILNEWTGAFLRLPENTRCVDYARINGKYLGYPSCCVEEYCRKRTSEEANAQRRKDHINSHTFSKELDALINEKGTYPEVFDYRPPSFTPCGIHCQNAVNVLSQWKDAIEHCDPEASNALMTFHRVEEPERRAHEETWAEHTKKKRLRALCQWLAGEHNHMFSQLRTRQKPDHKSHESSEMPCSTRHESAIRGKNHRFGKQLPATAAAVKKSNEKFTSVGTKLILALR